MTTIQRTIKERIMENVISIYQHYDYESRNGTISDDVYELYLELKTENGNHYYGDE